YTPAIMVVALLVAIVPPLFFASAWLPWIYKGLTLLLIGCPCAAGGPAFETLADQEQQQDHRRLRGGADKQRPDGGDAHQRF
ncbi:hypothetical protein GJD58_28385, partial [Klebsiella pneumoniae]|nr:hypothetical protein [Klebsiella pneumoniae]